MWQNSTTQIVIKFKNSKCDKTQLVTKLKLGQNSNCDRQNSSCDKTQIVTKLKFWEKSKTQIWQNSDCDKTWELKLWQNSQTQIVTKLKNWNWDMKYDKSQFMKIKQTLKCSFSRNILTP